MWQTVSAWAGLRYSVGLVSLRPHSSARRFPVLLPSGYGLVELTGDGRRIKRIKWLSGALRATIALHGATALEQVELQAGHSLSVGGG